MPRPVYTCNSPFPFGKSQLFRNLKGRKCCILLKFYGIAPLNPARDQDLWRMRSQIYRQMLATRGWKYRSFLRFLRLFKYVSLAPRRGSFLELYYVLMRYLDDVVDGDAPIPDGYGSPGEYLEEKIAFSRTLSNPQDPIDHLMRHCFELARGFGEEFGQETEDILNSLLFDARRRGTWQVFPAAVLKEHFHQMDIRGTIRATLKIFKDDPNKYPILEPLGLACRYQYDIEDIAADLAAGYVNLSQEEVVALGIPAEELRDPNSPGVRRWLLNHAREGLRLLGEHDSRVASGNFSRLARATFPPVYAWPARKVFRAILTQPEGFQSLEEKW